VARTIDEKPMLDAPKPYRWTVEEYEKACRAGLFQGVRVELLQGEVIQMPSMGDDHYISLVYLNARLVKAFAEVAWVAPQAPIRIAEDDSKPEPDFTLIPLERFKKAVPTQADVVLAVEISDSTLTYDRGDKLRGYARNGIPEVWIVNLRDNQLEAYSEPKGEEYLFKQTYQPGEAIAPKAFPDVPIEWW
jgi:Uma2 family endonuclease